MKTTLYTFGLLALVILFGADVFAQGAITVEPLTDIGVETGSQENIGSFVNQLYQYGVGIGAILAVLIIMYGGFRYMTSEAVGEKSAGREDIQRAVLGLLLLLSPVIVFGIINQDILNLNFNLDRLQYERNAIDNGIGGGGGVETAVCADISWEQDSFLGQQKNIISPDSFRSGHLPEEMSATDLSGCCSFAGGWLRSNNRRIPGTSREYTEVSCEYRDISMSVKSTIHFTDGTTLLGTAFNLFGDVKIGLCKDIDSADGSSWADNKINELYQDDTLNFDAGTLRRIGDESLVERLEIAGGSQSIGC